MACTKSLHIEQCAPSTDAGINLGHLCLGLLASDTCTRQSFRISSGFKASVPMLDIQTIKLSLRGQSQLNHLVLDAQIEDLLQ